MNRGLALEASLRAPSATPFVRLFEAYRADIGASQSDPRLLAIGEGTLLLYFYLRVQDDIVDEPTLADRGDVYTMEVLSSASVRAFGCAVGEHRGFFEFRERVLRSFATAAAWEVDVAWSGGPSFSASEPVLSFLGRKFLPLAVPLGALAFLAGRGADAAQIEAFVVELGSGLQIVNDVLNVAEDHAARRVSPILRRLYEDGRATTSTPGGVVRALLLSGSTFDEAMESARSQLAAAAETALRMGAGALAIECRRCSCRFAWVEVLDEALAGYRAYEALQFKVRVLLCGLVARLADRYAPRDRARCGQRGGGALSDAAHHRGRAVRI
jgi:hypothetical protein